MWYLCGRGRPFLIAISEKYYICVVGWDSFPARIPFWEELKKVSHAGGWISSEKHTQPHMERLFHQKGKFKKTEIMTFFFD